MQCATRNASVLNDAWREVKVKSLNRWLRSAPGAFGRFEIRVQVESGVKLHGRFLISEEADCAVVYTTMDSHCPVGANRIGNLRVELFEAFPAFLIAGMRRLHSRRQTIVVKRPLLRAPQMRLSGHSFSL